MNWLKSCRVLSLAVATAALLLGTNTAFPIENNFDGDARQIPVKRAIILIGGIYETSHYFDGWVPALTTPGTVVFGWDHNPRSMSMKASAVLLSKIIDELRTEGIDDVTVIAHSMGGLVAKGAIDELSRTGSASNFSQLKIVAFGTPWGGYALADLTSILPWSETISKIIGYPMGPDIGPSSAYMQSLTQPLPSNSELDIYIGTTDTIARPADRLEKIRYESIEALASTVISMKGFNHASYNMAPVELLDKSNIQKISMKWGT